MRIDAMDCCFQKTLGSAISKAQSNLKIVLLESSFHVGGPVSVRFSPSFIQEYVEGVLFRHRNLRNP